MSKIASMECDWEKNQDLAFDEDIEYTRYVDIKFIILSDEIHDVITHLWEY